MMLPRPLRESTPGRFDGRLKVQGWPTFHLMLAPKPYDVAASKLDEQASVAPTSYSPGSRNPFIEGTRSWGPWSLGAGSFRRVKDGSEEYGIANGIDASLGGSAILGPASTTVTPSGSGVGSPLSNYPIKQTLDFFDGSATHLYALAGTQVWKNAGDPATGSDWALSKEFAVSAPATPIGLAVVATGGTGTTHYTYVIVGRNGATDDSTSTPSTPLQITNGVATLTGAQYNTISWTDDPAIPFYEIWRTEGGTSQGLVATIAYGTGTVNDALPAVATQAVLPATAQTPQPTMLMSFFTQGKNYLYVAMTRGTYWRWDGTVWAQGAAAATFVSDPKGSVLAKVGRFFYRGISADASRNGNHIYRTQLDPFSTSSSGRGATGWESWGGDAGEFPFTSLVVLNDTLVSFTTGRFGVGSQLLDVTTGGSATYPTGNEDLSTDPGLLDTENGRTAYVWADPTGQKAIYARHGGSFLQIIPSSNQDAKVASVGVERMLQNQTAITGYVTAAVGHSTFFLYFTLYNPTTDLTYLCKLGTWLTPESSPSGKWEWAPSLHLALTSWSGVKALSLTVSATSSTASPCLYVGMDDGTFRRVILPKHSPNPIGDSACRYLTTGWIDLPTDDAGYGANLKSYHRATVLGQTLTEGQTASVSYALDGSSTFTAIDDTYTATGQSKDFPEAQEGHLIAPRLTLATDDATLTPEVHQLQIHAQVRGPSDVYGNPGFVRQRQLTVRCEDGLIDRMGYPLNLSPRQFRAALQAACAATQAELTLWDGVKRQISVVSFDEGDTIGPDGYTLHVITLTYLEQTLATGSNASGRLDPGWGP